MTVRARRPPERDVPFRRRCKHQGRTQRLTRLAPRRIHRAVGVVAQLVERVVRNDEVRGSIPLGSTILFPGSAACAAGDMVSADRTGVDPAPVRPTRSPSRRIRPPRAGRVQLIERAAAPLRSAPPHHPLVGYLPHMICRLARIGRDAPPQAVRWSPVSASDWQSFAEADGWTSDHDRSRADSGDCQPPCRTAP